MTARGLKPETERRISELIGAEPDAAGAYLAGAERRDEILRIVKQDEAENEEFYRELGDR